MGFWERRGSLMVIYDFDFVDVFAFPTKAEAPLVIDADGMKSNQIATQSLQMITRRYCQILQNFCGIKILKLSLNYSLDFIRKLSCVLCIQVVK
jgi:hypothetical protein